MRGTGLEDSRAHEHTRAIGCFGRFGLGGGWPEGECGLI